MESGFRHEALIYSDPDQFLAAHGPLSQRRSRGRRSGDGGGEPAQYRAAPRRAGRRCGGGGLRRDGRAGPQPGSDHSLLARFPRRRRQAARRAASANRSGPGARAAEIDECQRHESLLNRRLLSGTGWSLLCPYDGAALADEVLAAVSHSHRSVARDDTRETSGDYRRRASIAMRESFPVTRSTPMSSRYDRSRSGGGQAPRRTGRQSEPESPPGSGRPGRRCQRARRQQRRPRGRRRHPAHLARGRAAC